MKNVMSLLLMLVILGVVFIQSSEALRCYLCVAPCNVPTALTCDIGDVCLKVTTAAGIRL